MNMEMGNPSKRNETTNEGRSPSAYREAMAKIGAVVSYTQGISMRPLIWTGKHNVSIIPIDGEPKINDILLFEQVRKGETACILHRLIAKEADTYITRGDNCLGTERVKREEIIGRVEKIHRTGGWRPWFALRGKEISMTDSSYLRYVRLWNRLWPLRKQFYRLRAFLINNRYTHAVLRKIFRYSKIS